MESEESVIEGKKLEKMKQGLTICVIIITILGYTTFRFFNETNDAKFYFYYIETQQQFGVYNLEDKIGGWSWIKAYEEGVFDCSEMSAFLEMKLENEGWHTLIVAGESPFESGRHAWLLVETSEGKYIPVESTTLEIVWSDSPYFDNYFEYDHEFETIQEALEYDYDGYNWWLS